MTDFDNNNNNLNNLPEEDHSKDEHKTPQEPDWNTVPTAPTEESGYYRAQRPETREDVHQRAEEPPQQEPHQNSDFTDVNYIPTNDAYRDRNHYSSPYKEKPVKKKRRGLSGLGIAALCLACLILGCGGTYVALTVGDKDAASAEDTLPIENAISTPDVAPKSTPTLGAAPTPGNTMRAGDIYELACTQTVGVTTEITTNIFGQTTSSAVSGSGFVVTEDGYIITNYHVIEYAAKGGYAVSVMFYDGSTYPAEIVGYEPDNDLAVLKIEADRELNPVTIGDSTGMRVGDDVYAVGNPLGELTYTMTDGMVSALDREIVTSSEGEAINMFQISAAVNSGNSGGPVYNDKGEVIGIVTAKYSDTGVEGLGFAIPINDAVDIANDLIEYGYVTGKPYMGIAVTTVNAAVAKYYNLVEGAYIYTINEDGAAAAAGLQMGDIITSLNDTPITTSSEFIATLKNYKAGDVVTLTVYRAGSSFQVQVTLAEQQAAEPTVTTEGNTGDTVPGYGNYGGYGDPFSNFNF